MQQAIEENDTTGTFCHSSSILWLFIYVRACVCECKHIYALYICISLIMCSLFSYVFLWAEDGIKSSRELHNPINSYSGEVIYLI